MADDPTTRELLIQLQAAVAQITSLASRVDDLTRTLGSSYVPRGEWEEARRADERRFGEVEKDVEAQSSFRRQIAAGGLLLLLGLVANIVLNLSRIPGGAS